MKLTEDRFAELLDAWGGDLARWPAEWRHEAQAFVARSPQARAQLADAQAFDALLELPAPPSPAAALRRAILADAGSRLAPREHWLRRLWRELGGLRLAGPAFAASLVCGIAIAAYVEPPSTADGFAEDVADVDDADGGDLFAIAQLDGGYEEYAP